MSFKAPTSDKDLFLFSLCLGNRSLLTNMPAYTGQKGRFLPILLCVLFCISVATIVSNTSGLFKVKKIELTRNNLVPSAVTVTQIVHTHSPNQIVESNFDHAATVNSLTSPNVRKPAVQPFLDDPFFDFQTPTASESILTFKPLPDRMGSRLQMALGSIIVAKHFGWKVCFPKDSMTKWIGIPTCPPDLEYLPFPSNIDQPKEGHYIVSGYETSMWNFIHSKEEENPSSAWTTNLRSWWNSVIIDSWNRSGGELLWEDDEATHVAVHVRRGDVTPQNYGHAFIPDGVVLEQIDVVTKSLQRMYSNRKVEVHIFSEDYGRTDWDTYRKQGYILHLAGRQDKSPHKKRLRDWAHFLKADVLIVGGTFSAVPALGRSVQKSSDESIKPEFSTLFWGDNHGYFDGVNCRWEGWTPYFYSVKSLGRLNEPQLRSILQSHHLSTKGSKKVLIERLNAHNVSSSKRS
mmetsp:Transcript_1125/g.1618  ORF Transcript_1125/g.1618 Transcript_1125/m.1618 type:complete len:460 (+) Transcript_1125:1918-3297(+)